jgi:hypothetical protein
MEIAQDNSLIPASKFAPGGKTRNKPREIEPSVVKEENIDSPTDSSKKCETEQDLQPVSICATFYRIN